MSNRSRRSTRLRLRDRFFRASVAKAITSPAGIVSGSLVASVLLGAGAHPGTVLVAAATAWAVPVVQAMANLPGRAPRRRRSKPRSGESTGHWRAAVDDAENAVDRFRRAIDGCRRGPLSDRLRQLEEDVLQSLDSCRGLADWGADAESARRELDPSAMERVARRAGKQATDVARSQRQLVRDLLEVEREVKDRLSLINGRLDEAVGRAVEIVGRANDTERLGREQRAIGGAAIDIADELAALSAALHEVDDHEHPHRLRGERPARSKDPGPGTTATG